MKHIIFYIVVSILFVSVFSCKQRKNMQYLPFFYMKNYEVMHSKSIYQFEKMNIVTLMILVFFGIYTIKMESIILKNMVSL